MLLLISLNSNRKIFFFKMSENRDFFDQITEIIQKSTIISEILTKTKIKRKLRYSIRKNNIYKNCFKTSPSKA